MQDEFTQRPHHEHQHRPGECVGHDQRGTRHGDGLSRTQEQSHPDGASDGDHLDVAGLKRALQVVIRCGDLGRRA